MSPRCAFAWPPRVQVRLRAARFGVPNTLHTIGTDIRHHAVAYLALGHGVGAIFVMLAGSVNDQPTRRIARTAVLSDVKNTDLSGSIVVPWRMAM